MTWRLFIAAFAGLPLLIATANVIVSAADETKPYTIKDGKVDAHTYNGWRRYTESCLRCHGPDGAGSSYAPALTQSLTAMSEDQFKEVVINGRKNVSQSARVQHGTLDITWKIYHLDFHFFGIGYFYNPHAMVFQTTWMGLKQS